VAASVVHDSLVQRSFLVEDTDIVDEALGDYILDRGDKVPSLVVAFVMGVDMGVEGSLRVVDAVLGT
jgi:hypothetical protein